MLLFLDFCIEVEICVEVTPIRCIMDVRPARLIMDGEAELFAGVLVLLGAFDIPGGFLRACG